MVAVATPKPLRISAAEELVSSAGDALSQVAELLKPLDGETAAETTKRVDALEARREGPFVLAVAGADERAHADLLNRLLGEPLLDLERIAPAGARTRFRLGATPQYRAKLKDGTEEVFAERFQDRSGELSEALAECSQKIKEATAETVRLEKTLEHHAPWLTHAERAASAWDERITRARDSQIQAETLRARLLADRVAKRVAVEETRLGAVSKAFSWATPDRVRRAEAAERSLQDLEAMLLEAEARVVAASQMVKDAIEEKTRRVEPITQARTQRVELETQLAAARRARVAAANHKDKLEAELVSHVAARWQAFRKDLSALCDARARGDQVESLVVDVPGAALPEEVVILDIGARGSDADLQQGLEQCRRRADGCLWVGEGEPSPELAAVFLHITKVGPVPDGRLPDWMPEVLSRQRSLATGRSALSAVRAAGAALDQLEGRAQAAGKARVERLEKLRFPDVAGLVSRSLERLRSRVEEGTALALRHAQDQLAWELDRVEKDAVERLKKCKTVDQVRTTLVHLREDTLLAMRGVERGVQTRLLNVLASAAHDLHLPAVSEVAERVTEVVALLNEPPTPVGGSSHHRVRVHLSEEVLAPVRKVLEPATVQLGVGLQPLARSLLGDRPAAVFEGLAGGFAAKLRGITSIRFECNKVIRERLLALRKSAEADLTKAEPDLRPLVTEALEKLPARAALELERAIEVLAKAESAGLEHDLAHLKTALAGVRHELAAREATLLSRIGALGLEIDAIAAS